MNDQDPTRIGRVQHVLGSTVTVELDPELAGIAPIYRGELQNIGQIGSLVRIPQGLVDLIASVNLVGIAELSGPLEPNSNTNNNDERWLQVQLLGEIDHGTGSFQRGVGSYPGLDDPVHFTTPDHLQRIFPFPDENHVGIGCLSTSKEIPVSLEADKFVVRHSAIVGSTGSGKTSAVSSILQNFVKGGWDAANIVVIDPHGEYSSSLGEYASVRSVLKGGDEGLRVPYWALPAKDIATIFIGQSCGATFMNKFTELIKNARKEFVEVSTWLSINPNSITADTPIPFDLKEIWYQLDYENNETRQEKSDPDTVCIIDPGDPSTLTPAEFEPYRQNGPPNRGPKYHHYGNSPDLLRLGLLDPQLKFFRKPVGDPKGSDPLIKVMQEWIGGDAPISVLDFSGVHAEAADAAIGVILNLILEIAIRCDEDGPGIGRPSPVLIVIEEAHRFLGEDTADITRKSTNRIAREGRKYGVGLSLVTQRPTELPKTALSQCGTIISLRLSNSSDQGSIKATLPDTIEGLASVLPSLRTHEAVVSGDAVDLPIRALLDKPNPWPKAEDPSLKPWRTTSINPNIEPALNAWRNTHEGG